MTVSPTATLAPLAAAAAKPVPHGPAGERRAAGQPGHLEASGRVVVPRRAGHARLLHPNCR